VRRSVKWWKTCCEVRKGVECLVGGHVMVGGSVGRSEKGWSDCVEVWGGLEGLWGGQERSEGPVKRSGKVWRVCEEVGERGGGSLRMSGKG